MVDFNRLLQDRQLAKQIREQHMASRSQVAKDEFVDDGTKDVFIGDDINRAHPLEDSGPPEFATDEADDTTPNVGISESEFEGINTDDARDERTRATLDPPQGDWLKTDKFDFSYEFRPDDKMPGDIKPNGRTILKFAGNPDPRTVNGIEYTPRFFINISPDFRASERDAKKPDLTHQLWLRAKDLFMSVRQCKHKDIAELCKFLQVEEYIVRAAKSQSGDNLYVVGLKNKESLRGRAIK